MRLLLIDGHYYAYRSFFAIRDLSNSRGEATNAIYGFVKTMRRMVKDLSPDLGAVVWDMGVPARRTELQPEYKAQREAMPDDLSLQIPIIQRIVPLTGFASLGVPNTEADDLIASYATAARARGIEVIIATNDKDLYQLVDDGCRVYSTNKTDLPAPDVTYALLGEEKVKEKWGVSAKQIGEVLALIGDSVDNIPGVEGVGPKTAANLLNEFGNIDTLLSNLSTVKNEKLRARLESAVERIHQNREMVRLDLDLALPAALDDLTITPRLAELAAELEACEFKGLLAEVRADIKRSDIPTNAPTTPPHSAPVAPPQSAPVSAAPVQGELF